MDFLNIKHTNIKDEIEKELPRALVQLGILLDKEGKGKEYTGWIDDPFNFPDEELVRLMDTVAHIKEEADVLVVVGIGGSSLGACAVISALKKDFEESKFKVIFAGDNLSTREIRQMLDYLKDKDFFVNVVSKSGTTMETSICFRIFKDLLVEKYGRDWGQRVIATTGDNQGSLNTMARENGIKTFYIPEDIGGRYSAFTPVVLLPMFFAGFKGERFIQGGIRARDDFTQRNLTNPAIIYAAARYVLYSQGKDIELLVNTEPKMEQFSQWWRQLFGESEGKEGQGIFPATALYPRDLHSLGQLVQDGKKNIFETLIITDEEEEDIVIQASESDRGLEYIEGHRLSFINRMTIKGAVIAHSQGGVPVIIINIEKIDEYWLGYLMYFFMVACSVSGYLREINPFDQPGVEEYKANVRRLLR